MLSPRDLDARLIPRLAAMLRALLDGTAARRSSVTSAVRRRGTALLAPTGAGALRRLDDRYASRGPLGLLRDVPQLGVLLVAAVFLAGAGAALVLRGGDTVAVQQQVEQPSGQDADGALALGPPVGADTDAHLAEARDRVLELSVDAAGSRRLALVSLRQGLTPEQTGQLLQESGLELARGYLRAPTSGRPEEVVFQTPGDPVAGLREVFGALATRKAQEQRDLLVTAATIVPGSPQAENFQALYERDARTAGEEDAAYRTGCGCVFALVVEAEVGELADLATLAVVRGVEVAPRGADLAALDVRPLSPDEQGVVVAERPADAP